MRRLRTVFRERKEAQATPGISKGHLSSQLENPAFPDGIKIWHDCPDAIVDICFIHGLTGNRDSTWTAQGREIPWPKHLLPAYLPKARILTYGYDAYVVRASPVSENRLLDHATNLLVDLTNDRRRAYASKRPLIIVAHSLGGLVCKEAILLSRRHHDSHLHDVFDSVIGVAFMGAPHKGSWMADWAKTPASALGLVRSTNRKLLAILQTNSQLLESMQAGFLSLIREAREGGRPLDVTCFFEELPMPVAGRVVSRESATLDSYMSISIHANHRDMVRFVSDEDTGFQRLLGELKRWTDIAVSAAKGREDDERISSPGVVVPNSAPYPTRKTCCYIPFPRNKRFVGREATLKRLQDMFFTHDYQKVALVGLGGIGKTQVALQLAYWVKEHRPEYHIFWIPVLSTATFEEAYVEIAGQLALKKRSDDEDLKDIVRRHLSSDAAGPWLLIVDNADDADVLFAASGLSKYLPESDSGLTLFTTRSREVAIETAGSEVVDLSNMDWTEATSFLEKSLIRKDLIDDVVVKVLLEELTYLPLGISQAAAYLNKNQVTITEYLELLHGAEDTMVSLLSRDFRDRTRYAESQNSVAATWLVSFEQIRKLDPLAADLLSFISFIEPKAIPQSLFLRPESSMREQLTNAIGTLCAYAFLTRRGDGDLFDMHSLVHMAIHIWLERNQRVHGAHVEALRYFIARLPIPGRRNRHLWRGLLPHAICLISRCEECQAKVNYELHLFVGSLLITDRRPKEAIAVLGQAAAWMRGHLAEDDARRLEVEYSLGRAYVDDREVKEALKLMQHVVSIQQLTVPEDDSNLLSSRYELAKAYVNDGQLEVAIGIIERVVEIQKTRLAEDDDHLLASEHELARAYLNNKEIKEGTQIMEHVVKMRRATLAEDDHNRLASEGSLGRAYIADGRVKEGLPLLERVVQIRERTLPQRHIDILSAQHNLVAAYKMDHQIDKAVALLERVVEARQKMLPEEHSFRMLTEHELVHLYRDCGQEEKAIKLLEHLISVEERTLPDKHRWRLRSIGFLAYEYLTHGQPGKAKDLLEFLVPLQRRAFGEEDQELLRSQHSLAHAYEDLGLFDLAKDLLDHVIAVEANSRPDGQSGPSVSERALARISPLAN